MIWNGETWTCMVCGWVNAVIRRRCRNCGRPNYDPGYATR
jgi:hypothetical protein